MAHKPLLRHNQPLNLLSPLACEANSVQSHYFLSSASAHLLQPPLSSYRVTSPEGQSSSTMASRFIGRSNSIPIPLTRSFATAERDAQQLTSTLAPTSSLRIPGSRWPTLADTTAAPSKEPLLPVAQPRDRRQSDSEAWFLVTSPVVLHCHPSLRTEARYLPQPREVLADGFFALSGDPAPAAGASPSSRENRTSASIRPPPALSHRFYALAQSTFYNLP